MVDRPPHLVPPPLDESDPKVQMNVRLPRSLIQTMDLRRASLGISRDEWVCRALMFALRTPPGTPADQSVTVTSRDWSNGTRTQHRTPRRPL